MKLAIIGDMHLGFSYNTERRDDSFKQAEEAIDIALKENADAILLAGDIFDTRVPSPEILGRAMELFRKIKGIHVLAINGNHDRRGKGYLNPVQLLEKAGLLIRLHASTEILEKENDKIAVHGLSHVPERYAREVLEKWNPKPVQNAYNILLMHQNIGQYVYAEDEFSMLKLEDLPAGFDLIVDGHIHWSDQKSFHGNNLLITGATVSTQMRAIESEKPKGIWILENQKLDFRKLKSARPLYYKKLKFEDLTPDKVLEKIEQELKQTQTGKPKPLVRIVLNGTLKKGYESTDLNLSSLEREFAEKFILHIGKERVLSYELVGKKELLEKLKKSHLPIEELGHELLRKHLKNMEYSNIEKSGEFLNKLVDGNMEDIYAFLKKSNGPAG